MAVIQNPFDTRLTLVFYVGDDEFGNPIERSKAFANVKPEADDQALYDLAHALADLQTYPLVQVQRTDRVLLVNEE